MALKAPKRNSFAIIGLGTFGSSVAREMMRHGNHVIGADLDDRVVADHAEALSEAVILDARDDIALREAGIADCDVAVVAMGEDLEASVLAAINLKMIGVPTVWAKAVSRTHHRILGKLGVDRVIHPEQEMGRRVGEMLQNPRLRDYAGLGNGFSVVTYLVPETLAGKTIDDLGIEPGGNLRCLGAMRGSEWLGLAPQSLAADDRLILLGKPAELRRFAMRF
jgi:trk system potassium uptake protein TrkA